MTNRKGRTSERILERFPKERVQSRREMARLLSKYRWLLEAMARKHLGDTPEVGETVNSVVAEMLAIEDPDMEHALRVVTRALHAACYAVLRARARVPSPAEKAWAKGIPYDPVLRRWTKQMAVAVKELPDQQRVVFTLVSKGVSIGDLATALGVQPKTIRMHLYWARIHLRPLAAKRSAFAFPGLLGLRRSRHRLTTLATQTRGAGLRWTGLADGPASLTPSLSNATMLASLVVWSLTTTAAIPAVAVAETARPTPVGAALSIEAVSAQRASSDSNGGPAQTVPLLRIAVPRVVLPHGAEAPAGAQLVAATPAPSYQTTHTIVALGQDPACACAMLFQSTDGGHTWAARPGPPSGVQVALPPDYPADPRIFIGSAASPIGGADYVVERFGGGYAPLPGSPGSLAVSGDFDSGDPEVYVATATGVMAIDMSTGVPAAPVVATGVWGPASLASEPGVAGVLALAPPGSLAPTGVASGAWATAGSSALLSCHGAACRKVADLSGTGAQSLVVSATYPADHALVVVTNDQRLAVSTNRGSSFSSLELPDALGAIRSVAVAAGRVWIAAGGGAQPGRFGWVTLDGGVWHELTSTDPALAAQGSVVAVGGDRLLYLVRDRGFRCSGNGGRSWADVCPSTG